MAETKTISEAVALQARGLFALGEFHYKKLRDAERALHELLGYDDQDGHYCNCLSDALYKNGGGSFDAALAKDGFVVQPPPAMKG